jgi:anaerobic magnesium-protoporphyrin IX monomethyl ester cyclase
MILLTHNYFISEDEREQKIMKPYVPLGILYISAYLEKHAVQHEVYDTTFSSFAEFKEYLLEKKPRLIGIYTNLMTKLNVLHTIQFIRSHKDLQHCSIILGGPEIRYNAENYLRHGAHMLAIGEGEETFYEICDRLLKDGKLAYDVKGTAYLKGDAVCFNEERTLIRNMDDLPMPARHKIALEKYGNAWKTRHGYSMYSLSTMRGCPYTCKWCSRAVYGGTYRRRSPRLVVDEMQLLASRYQPDRIWFVDDVFTISHKWLKGFHEEIMSRKLHIPYEIITRADRMSDEVIALLKESGCFRVWIGAESGAQEVIDAMDRRVDVTQVREMIIKTRKAGMQAGTFIMLGYPGEKRKHINQTIIHLKLSMPDEYTITLAYPITGTPLHEEVKGKLTNERDWSTQTDRDLDFYRGHGSGYYKNALRWIYNEVSYSRTDKISQRLKFKAKSMLAQTLMLFD